jgi:tRNA-specific 2-thiouridylase
VEIGQHAGVHRVTVGQRRGLQVAGSAPRYVLRVLPETRAVVVGDAAALRRGALEIEDLRRLAPIGESARWCARRCRSGTAGDPSRRRSRSRGAARVRFDAPVGRRRRGRRR